MWDILFVWGFLHFFVVMHMRAPKTAPVNPKLAFSYTEKRKPREKFPGFSSTKENY